MKNKSLIIDNVLVPIGEEKNLLELIRKANIELPTFCYHSGISVYGACRMCMVEVEGRGIVPACSTAAVDGMVVSTNTRQIRSMRKMIIELMLANHDQNCTTCPKSGDCRLQSIAKQMGVEQIRFRKHRDIHPVDTSSDAIIRDPSKCVLCGDCVRVCNEIQSVGALDLAYRGADSKVVSTFNKNLSEIECVGCGQCVKVCPVGALMPKYQVDDVWNAIYDKKKVVVAQIAPSVRVSFGEYFGLKPGTTSIGQIISSLRRMGFDRVFDMAFAADFTVVEEGNEFLNRLADNEKLPMLTSCCPAWVKFAEQYYPEMLGNLSSCRSPQQIFGALCKDQITREFSISREDLIIVSIVPCTAKKFEAKRNEFKQNDNPDVDFVITTKELALMIKESGIDFDKLEPSSFDMPFGFTTGAGIIFGSSGGVSEAVLRYVSGTLSKGSAQEFKQLRGEEGIKIAEVEVGNHFLRIAAVSGLANARSLIEKIRQGTERFDLVEIMACCGGCAAGGGQPAEEDSGVISDRTRGLYDNDRMLQFHVSSESPYLQKIYHESLNDEKARTLLHTTYENRRRILQEEMFLTKVSGNKKLSLTICFGTSCFLRGAQDLYAQLMEYIRQHQLEEQVEFTASFCGQHCKSGPVVQIDGQPILACTLEKAITEIEKALQKQARR